MYGQNFNQKLVMKISTCAGRQLAPPLNFLQSYLKAISGLYLSLIFDISARKDV